MPGKGRRVASRQSQLGQRRRRNSKSVQSTTNAVISSGTHVPNATPDGVTAVAEGSVVADLNHPVSESRSRTNLADRSTSDTHIKSEITRIVILGSVLTISLLGLSFLI
ncbi:MAG: hypothetical protein VX966_11170 [Chloroflexota bacterium]|nr:hypothetical protein [Chloroflexota bacterium]